VQEAARLKVSGDARRSVRDGWPLDPHTLAKHEILRRYLYAWFPIMSCYNGRLVFLDGFAGPGAYE
jgi:hypothetical protein